MASTCSKTRLADSAVPCESDYLKSAANQNREGVFLARSTQLDLRYVSRSVRLPYGLRVTKWRKQHPRHTRLFHGLNDFLEGNGFRPLEELLLGNSLSGIISESLGKNIASVLRRTERISKSLRSMNSESRRSRPAIFEICQSNLSCKTVPQHRSP